MSQLTPFVEQEKTVLLFIKLLKTFEKHLYNFLFFKILYFKNLVSLVLSQVLSPNFHIRTYAEATLMKLHLLCNDKESTSHKLNDKIFTGHSEIKPLLDVIYSILKDIIDE
jgi:hypothetical protein